MNNRIIKVYDNYKHCGIINRKMTEGKEKELVESFIDQFIEKRKKDAGHYIIFVETKVGSTYPDIVFVKYNPKYYKKWNEKRNLLKPQDMKVLSFIYNSKYTSVSDISKCLGIKEMKIRKIVKRLIESDLVINTKNGYKVKNRKMLSSIKIKSIEAKINKWKDVLNQSVMNKNFSDESYVLVKSNTIPSSKIYNQYKKLDIGIYYTNDSFVIEENKPVISNNNTNYYKLMFNEWVGRVLNNKEFINVN